MKYNYNDQTEEYGMGGTYSMNGGEWDSAWLLVRKIKGKRPLARPRLRWVNDIKIDFGKGECSGFD
jgi:hypothetical protein